LGVVTSRRVNTVRQIEFAISQGVPVVCPDVGWFTNPEASVHSVVKVLQTQLSTHGWALLTAHELPDLPGKSAIICSRLAEVVSAMMPVIPPAGMVLTGGDIVYALSIALGTQAIRLCGEVQPGIPWGCLLGGRADGCATVTKAGGFGDDSTLVKALEFLRSAKGNCG
jgi:uncharacterized protein YgbK (DUF1537 family)